MMLTIHGLPTNISYPNLKAVIKKECKITEFILGVLALDDDETKKVRIGVADDKEGNIVMKCLDGYRLSGHVLRVIPIGKSNSTYNDTNYEWRSNQQGSNYDNRAIEPVPNRSTQWPIQSTTQWNTNQQEISPQMQNQTNFGFSQQGPNIQPSFYQRHEVRPQNKMYEQQESYSQNRGVQQQTFTSTKDHKIPYGNRNTSNIIKPQRSNQSRPHILTNVEIIEHPPTRPQVQGGRYPAQDYNTKGTDVKEHFQGSSQYNANVQSNQPQQGHYEDQVYNPQWSTHKTYTIPKTHGSSQYEKQSYGNDMMQTDKGMIHDQGKGPNEWNQYEKGRRSPQRDRSGLPERRVSPSGHRVSPSGHRILPSGRRISPHRRNSPLGPNAPPTGRRVSPSGRRISPSGRRFSPRRDLLQHGRDIPASGRRMSPPGRIISPSGRRFSPSSRQISQPSQGISPSGRKISPSGRNIPQTGRGIPPTGRLSPSERKISPSGRRDSPAGRRNSPHGRQMSPIDRRMSPSGRRISPTGHRGPQSDHRPLPNVHRISPSNRRISPGHKGGTHLGQRLSPRRMSPGKPHRDISTIGRASPNLGPSHREYGRYSSPHTDNMRPIPDKDVRPAYDPTPQAQSQPMYSGGYAQRPRENVQFATTASRSGDQRPIWQEREKPYNTLKPIDDRGVVPRNQKFDSPRELDYQRGINQPEGKLHSPGRLSRSPNRRERSPIRDRYRRHSPSPRSPRRSWALEKRQSPENHETQLPLAWQSKESPYAMQNRPNDQRIIDSVWEKPYEEKDSPVIPRKEDTRSQDLGDRRYYSSPPRTRWGPKVALPIEHRDPSLTLVRQEDRFQIQRTKFSPRDDFLRHVPADCETRQERGGHRDFIQDHKNENYRQRSDERKSDLRLGPDALEIEDVFKRAAELAKKTEEHRKKRSEKGNYSKEPESLRDEKRETKSYDKPVRSNQNPYEASSSYRGSGHSRDFRNVDLSPNVQYKRDKAIDELTEKLLLKYSPDLKGKNRDEVEERLKLIIESIIFDMFGDRDVSFIEIVIKFEDRHHNKELERIMQRAMSDAPIESKRLKRSAPDESHVPAKISRDSPSPSMNRDQSLPNSNRPLPQREKAAKRPVPVKRTEQAGRAQPLRRSTPVERIPEGKAVGPKKDPKHEEDESPTADVLKKELPKAVDCKKESPVKIENKEDKNKVEFKNEERKEEEKVEREELESKPRSEKKYELDARHSHALNLELQRIMIKVWQEFPDKPTSAEEKLVADKFRNEAGDALRNVIGLHVTKRILNFNGGLYVKLYFKGRPDRSQLSSFMRKHNMRTFKCIDIHAHIYAAQIGSFEDFDKICTAQEVLCGRANVTVRPCYSFTSFPSNLKTIFSGINDSEPKDTEDDDKEHDKTAQVNKDAKKETETIKTNKSSASQIKTEVRSEVTKEKVSPEITKTTKSIEVTTKEKPETEKVNTGNKTKSQTSNVTDKSKKMETKSEPVKRKAINQNSPITQSAKDRVKRVDKKEAVNMKAVSKKINYGRLEILDEYDAKDTGEIPEEDFAEEDEMDDKDILALMSEGIILDECGSEEE